MTYTKPTITVLGDAVRVIQGTKNSTPESDSPYADFHQIPLQPPAYELDE